ncbi:MAG: tRNA-dihydrouridine synthase, partial [Anaerovoracaceae bacterium]|nr:tRNA-dihydrouridine synthase [Anaerovoracaceae bacterium]
MLSTYILGMKLDTPVVIAPGPWSRGTDNLRKAFESGAGAVFTETITGESYPDLSPRYEFSNVTGGLENIRLYSKLDLEEWIGILYEVDDKKRFGSSAKLIASVMGSSPSELAYVARKVERTGVDGIELGLACPMGEGPAVVAGNPDMVYEYVKTACDAVSLPVSVKLSSSCADLPLVVRACIRAGAKGVSAIDTVRGILSIDIEKRTAGLPTYGGYSGAPIRPIGLSTVAGIAQTSSIPVVGIGGIENYVNLIEYIMAGASAGAVGSQILLRGYDVVSEIVEGFDRWTGEQGIADIEDIRGAALSSLRSFEELKVESKVAQT